MNLPPYLNFPVLISAAVALRQVLPTDADSLLKISFYDARPARDIADAAAMQAKFMPTTRRGRPFIG